MVALEAHLTHYRLLGVEPGATVEQIERAYRYAMEMYAEGSLATYSLLDPTEVREARLRIEQAYGVLSEPTRRKQYDAMLTFGSGETAPSSAEPPLAREVPPRPVLSSPAPLAALVPPSTVARIGPAAGPVGGHIAPPAHLPARPLTEPVTGPNLRRFRQEAGVGLTDIAAASKIGVHFFEYIEAERFDLLPATVYLRGFLKEYAKALGLDPMLIADAYLARVPTES